MCLTDNEPEDVDQSSVLHFVLRQHHKSRRHTYTIRVPLVLQKKALPIGDEQTTIADDDVE